jgi:CHAT domain-containing protein
LREAVTMLEASRAARPTGTPEARMQLVPRLQSYYGVPMRIAAEQGNAGEAFTLLDRMHEKLRRARCTTGCDDAVSSASPIDTLKRNVEPGTMMVAFSVQSAATYAFVGTRDTPLRVYRIDEKAAALADRVQQFEQKVRTRTSAASYEVALVADGKALFTTLFGQFEDDALKAERLLIVPDGPLESLPFSALVRTPTGARISWQYLVDWKPMVFAPSLTQAAAWSSGTAVPASVGQLLPSDDEGGAGAKIVGGSMSGGALVSLWTPAERTVDELADLFKGSLSQGRPREAALARAQRVLRDERGRQHPAYWAAYRYYGARNVR